MRDKITIKDRSYAQLGFVRPIEEPHRAIETAIKMHDARKVAESTMFL